MTLLFTILVTFFAGMGAGLGTGFAGMSAAAVISPMLITFLDVDPYMAVGIALSSDVLASAVSAYVYGKNKNLDIRNGVIMMVSVLIFTVIGSYISSLVPSTTMGNFSVFMTFLLHCKAGHDDKRIHGAGLRKKTCHPVGCLRRDHRIYLRFHRCRRRHDDALNFNLRAGLRVKDRGWHERIYHDFHRSHRSRVALCHRRRSRLDNLSSVRGVHVPLGENRIRIRQ